jgi:hypothetical protein
MSSHGIAELEALLDRGGDALLLLDTDHRARLRGDLEGIQLEERRAAHQPHQVPLGVGHRVLRVVAVDGELHRVGHRHLGLQRERCAEHHVAQARLASLKSRSRIVTRPPSLPLGRPRRGR